MNLCTQVVGDRGTGKSTILRARLRDLSVRRRIIIDPLRDYAAETEAHCRDLGELHDYLDNVRRDRGEFSVSITPLNPKDEARILDEACKWALYLRNTVVLVEEAEGSLSASRVPDSAVKAIKRGRHYGELGVSIWAAGQREVDIDIDCRAEMRRETWYLHLEEPADLERVRKRRGGEIIAAKLEVLPDLMSIRLAKGRMPELYRLVPGPDPRLEYVANIPI